MIGHNSRFVKDEDVERAVEFFRTLQEKIKAATYDKAKAKALKERTLAKLAMSVPGKSMVEKQSIAIQQKEYIDIEEEYCRAEAEEAATIYGYRACEAIRSIYQTQSANERG